MTETPQRYIPETGNWENKEWLQEKYWDEMLSAEEIAEECDRSKSVILKNMRELGIPRRVGEYQRQNSVSPFTGFYKHETARTDEESRSHFDPDFGRKVEKEDLQWQKVAKQEDSVGDDAIFG